MLDIAGTLVLAATIAVLLVAVVTTIPLRFTQQLTFAAVTGVCIGVVVAVAASGLLASLPILLILFSAPLVVVAAFSAVSTPFRAALLAIPPQRIIALNAFRVLGVLFLLLAAAGRLGGPFPLSAGIGDILTGVFALAVANIATRTSVTNRRVLEWNAFGALDLIVAVTLGITSRDGSPLQLIHAGAGSAAITTLPWALVPTFLVPVYLIGHAILFAQMRERAASRTSARLGRTDQILAQVP